jgi:hypothetical protein
VPLGEALPDDGEVVVDDEAAVGSAGSSPDEQPVRRAAASRTGESRRSWCTDLTVVRSVAGGNRCGQLRR